MAASSSIVLLVACATGGSAERTRQLEERVDRLEAGEGGAAPRADADRAAAKEQAQRVEARLGALEAKAAEAERARAAAPAGEAASAQISQEIARLRKQLEEQARRLDATDRTIARLQADSAERRASTSTRPSSRAPRGAPDRPRTPPATTPAPSGAAAAAGTPPSDAGQAEVLTLARQQEANGQRDVARDLYEEYVRRYPTGSGAAEARFRLGELAFAERRYQDAIVEYGVVARDFARSERAPDALLRTAESMLAAGMSEEAKTVLADVPRRYPNSKAAAAARQRLSSLGPTATPGKQ